MKDIIFLAMCFILVSCSGKDGVPAEILSKKQMQDILWDVMRAQALSTEMARKDPAINEVAQTKILTGKVFEIHHITSSVFDQSYAWYTGHPQVMRVIFDSMNSQNQRQSELRMKGGYKAYKSDSAKSKMIESHGQNGVKMKEGVHPFFKDSLKLKAIEERKQSELRMKAGKKGLLKDSVKVKAIEKQRQSELGMKAGKNGLLKDSVKIKAMHDQRIMDFKMKMRSERLLRDSLKLKGIR